MKNRVFTALLMGLISVGIHAYLTYEFYVMKFGLATGPSICNLNSKFDCDAVAASQYAALFGIPVALWGAVTNFILVSLILLAWLEWSENAERLRRWAFLFSAAILAGSIVMGGISVLFLNTYCPFCIALYALSLIGFLAYLRVPREPVSNQISADLQELFGPGKNLLFAILAVPVLTFLLHKMILANLLDSPSGQGKADMDRVVNEAIARWQSEKVQEFVAKPSVAMGASSASAALTLVEFADFRCGHCKHASYTLDAFVKSHPDVRFEFYAFPLDGICNEKITGGDGISCRLAQAVYCAEKAGKGWDMHHALYAIQERVHQVRSIADLDTVLAKESGQLSLSWETVKNCLADPSTGDAIRAQAKQGNLVDVRGTPTIFANGRLLEGGQMMPVLEAVYENRAKP